MIGKNTIAIGLFGLVYLIHLLEYYSVILLSLHISLGELVYNHYLKSTFTYIPDFVGLYAITNLIDNFKKIMIPELLYIILYVNISDTFQQVIGKKYGKYKPLVNISPNKTLEGYLGGLVCCTVMTYVTNIGIVYYALGVAGDLTYAYIKRHLNIKDWSCILGEHGGVLDRMNSSIFALNYFLLCNK